MSVPLALLAAPNLTARAKVVRVVLEQHADTDGLYHGTGGWTRLAKLTGFSAKTVQRSLLELEAFGSVRRVAHGQLPSNVRLLDRTPSRSNEVRRP